MSKAFFAGSFNPFTIGHASIVERALAVFDCIVIAIGVNADKVLPEDLSRLDNLSGCDDLDNLAAIRRFARKFPPGKIEVIKFSNELTVDVAKRVGANCLLRGVRSVKDFEYERAMADINRKIGGLETILLYALPEYEAVSSSMVRELKVYGRDVAQFLP